MLIEIDDSVMMALKNENPNDEHVILSLTNLFVSSYQGYHILHASIDSLEYFSKMNLGKIAQTTIQTLIKKYSSYKSLTKNISKKLIIYKNKCIQNIGSDFSMDISNVAAINKSVLISENHQDGYFYLSLARELAKESKQNWEINMSIESCGGSQIKETANNTINTEKRFSLMIVDSDKTKSTSSKGSTAKDLLRFITRNPTSIVATPYILKVREKENLIPPSFYIKLSQHQNNKWLSFLSTVEDDDEYIEFLRFSDIKDDVGKVNDVSNYSSIMQKIHTFITDDNKGVGKNAVTQFKDLILDHGITTKKNDFIQKISGGMGVKNNSNDTLEYLSRIEDFSNHIIDYIPKYLKEDWYEIYDLVAVFGCCLPEMIRMNA